MALHVLCDDRTVQHVERGEQRRRAMPFVIIGHRTGAALLHRQAGLGPVESLDLRLLINRQHHGMGRRVDIQADDIRELLGKGGIIGELEVPPAVRAEASQDTFYVGTLKGVGRIYQQSYVDPYSKVAQAKLYTTKTPITAADLLNDRVLPFHDEHDLPVLRIMTDRGTEYCGRVDKHDYQLFLAINDIDHTKTKVKSPQTNGIRERFHKTVLQEFYQAAFRKRLYDSVDALQDDLDQWLHHYNTERTHQGKMCCGRTPFQTMIEGKEIWKEKFVN